MQRTFSRPGRWRALAIVVMVAGSVPAVVGQTTSATPVYRWTTLAGLALTGFDDGPALHARFNNPHGVALDAGGNVYVADTANHTIRKISAQGIVTTLAGAPNQPGSVDGMGSAARFTLPEDVAVDAAGNIYVADTGNYTIRKMTPDGAVTTLAGQTGRRGTTDGPASSAQFTLPTKIFADASGAVYVVDAGQLRRIFAGTVQPVSLAGPLVLGTGETVDVGTLASRGGLAVDAAGRIYLSVGPATSAFGWKRIVQRDVSGAYSILASSVGTDNKPFISDQTTEVAMTVDGAGNLYFVSRLISSIVEYSLYKISPAGTLSRPNWGSLNRGSTFDGPLGLAADAAERIVHTNSLDDVVLQATPQSFGVFAGIPWSNRVVDGNGADARFSNIAALSVDRGSQVLVADSQVRYNVHFSGGAELAKVSPTGNTSTFYQGPLTESPREMSSGVALGVSDNLILGVRSTHAEFRQITPGGAVTSLPSGDFLVMNAMAADATGRLLVADNQGRVHRRSAAGEWSVLAGASAAAEIRDGAGTDARFARIDALSVAANGDAYVLDSTTTPEPRVVVRKIQPTGSVTTISGNLVKGTDIGPGRLAIDAKGDLVLTYSDDTVRLLSAGGPEFIIGGVSGQSGVRDGDGQTARFYLPGAVTTDPQNNVFVADNGGVTVRKGEFLGYNATISGQPQSITVAAGSNAQFSVTAAGTPVPSYQWQFNGVAINGAAASTLTLANVSPANAGSYTVVVANTLGSVTSNAATLTVTSAPSNPPPSGGSGGSSSGGGGGAPGLWFYLALALAGIARRLLPRRG